MKNIQVKLTFQSDTKAAKQQIAELQQNLSNLATTPLFDANGKMKAGIAEATQDALKLKVALNAATNVDTGKINFSKLNRELKQSGTGVKQLAASFQALGPAGVQAFSQLAIAIKNSETPLFALEGRLKKLMETFGNTIRWQFSSSLIQGFSSAISGTIDYAMELNKSLNNIRIVTGKSTEQMAQFAKEANKAAKSLSTSTTAYTDASLIYYQQGLADKEVKQRTDTTVKLANVVGKNAEEVSNWMTAIWNNFDDGSQSMEHYADVLAKLGAATASSADEIAGGIEKFASISKTVGLSYEYAAGALATITAETRQSEEVVGTALKTIFARVENLKLGETLEDGTNLGQYSDALLKVGVNINDANGNLKAMDDILNEIGSKWEILGKNEQVALAQSVAGIRQYNQFMALMDNWDVMEKNVEMAKNANGELEKMNYIYEQGVEAATKRNQAALEGIKNTLLDEESLVPILNATEDILKFVDNLIESMGGLPGLLTLTGSLVMKYFGPQIANSMTNAWRGLTDTFHALTGKAQQERLKTIQEVNAASGNMFANLGTDKESTVISQSLKEQAEYSTRLEEIGRNITEEKKELIKLQMQSLELARQEEQAAAKKADESEKEVEQIKNKIGENNLSNNIDVSEIETRGKRRAVAQSLQAGRYISKDIMDEADIKDENYEKARKEYDTARQQFAKGKISEEKLQEAQNALKDAGQALATDIINKLESTEIDLKVKIEKQRTDANEQNFLKDNQNADLNINEVKNKNQNIISTMKDTGKDTSQLEALDKKYRNAIITLNKAKNTIKDVNGAFDKNGKLTKEGRALLEKEIKTVGDSKKAFEQEARSLEKVNDELDDLIQSQNDLENKKTEEYTHEIDAENKRKQADEIGKQVDENLNDDPEVKRMNAIAGAASGLMAGVSAVQMFKGAFDSLTDSIANNEAGLSEWLSAIGSGIMSGMQLFSSISQITKAITGMGLAETIAAKRKKKANQEGMASDAAAAAVALGKGMAEAGARAAAFDPTGLIIMAGVIAAVATLIGGIAAVNVKTSAAADKRNAEAASAEADETNQTAKNNQELIDSYNDLLQKYEETGKGKEELAAKAQEIASAYGIEGAAIAALTGDYSRLTEAINEARLKELDKVIDDNDTAKHANKNELKTAFKKGNGMESNGGYGVEFSDSGKGGANNAAMIGIAKAYVANNPELSDIVWFGGAGPGDIQFNIDDIDDPDQLMALYEAVEGATKEARAQDVDGEIYDDMMEWLSKSKESYEKVAQYKSAADTAKGQKKVTETKVNGKSYNELSNYKEYQSYKAKVLEGVAEGSTEYNAIMQELGSNSATAELERIDQIATTQFKKGKDLAKDWITSLYTNSSEAWIKAYASVDATGLTQEEFLDRAEDAYVKALQAEKHETAKALGIEAKAADLFTSILKGSNSVLAEHADLAEMAAKKLIVLSKASEKATKAWKEYKNVLLSSGDKNNLAYATALSKMETELKGVFGLEDSIFDFTTYLNNNLKTMQKYFAGDTSTINEMRRGFANVINEAYVGAFDDIDVDSLLRAKLGDSVNVADFEELYKTHKNGLTEYLNAFGFAIATSTDGTIESIKRIVDNSEIEYSLKEYREEIEESIKPLEDTVEKYYSIKKAIELCEKAISIYGKQAERVFGGKSFKYLEAIVDQYDIAIEKQKELNQNTFNELNNSQQKLMNLGYSFDDQGLITNFDKVSAELQKQYEAQMRAGNTENAEKARAEWQKAFDDYNKYLDDWYAGQEKLDDLEYEKNNARLDNTLKKIELNKKLSEINLENLEWQLKRIDDDASKAAESIALMTEKATQIQTDIEGSKAGIRLVLDDIGIDEDSIKQFVDDPVNNMHLLDNITISDYQAEKLQEYMSSLRENIDLLKETGQAIQDELVESMTHYNEKINESIEGIEYQQQLMDNYKNIIDLVGKDRLGISDAILEQMNQQKIGNSQSIVAAKQALYETNKKAYEDAVASGAVDDEHLQELKRQMEESAIGVQEALISSLETISQAFEDSVTNILENYNEAMGDIAEKSELFEKQSKIEDFYLKAYEKNYEISKLNRQLTEKINSTDSAAAASKLRDVQAELLDYQKDGKKMSDYDLQYLQKKYDLTIAQNALEDAQNAKSQARLTRDASGNFGYVYTANQKNIESAQQQYEDKLYAMEQFMDQSVNDLSKQWFELNQQWADEMAALDKNAVDYEEKAAQITAYYTELMENVSGEMTDMVQYGMEINQEYGTHAAETFQETILGKMYSDYTTFEELQAKTTQTMNKTLDSIIAKHVEFKEQSDISLEAAGISTKDFKDDFVKWMGESQSKVEGLENDIAGMASEFQTGFNNALTKTKEFKDTFGDYLGETEKEVIYLSNLISNFLTDYSKLPDKDELKDYDPNNGKDGKDTSDLGVETTNTEGADLSKDTRTIYSAIPSGMSLGDWLRKNKYGTRKQFEEKHGAIKEVVGLDGKTTTYYMPYTTSTHEANAKLADESHIWYSADQINGFVDSANAETYKYNQIISQTTFDDLQSLKLIGLGSSIKAEGYNGNGITRKRTLSKGSDAWEIYRTGQGGNTGKWVEVRDPTNGEVYRMTWEYFTDKGGYNTSAFRFLRAISTNGINEYKSTIDSMIEKYDLDTVYTFITELKDTKALSPNLMLSYDTGGYTGSWGPEGRMAILHQKEIILNAHDTENFLTAIEIVRSIATQLENNALRTSQGLGALVTAAAVNNNREVLEQNVTIHAEFPNATDHNEIELAFNDLINQASQYVNRR